MIKLPALSSASFGGFPTILLLALSSALPFSPLLAAEPPPAPVVVAPVAARELAPTIQVTGDVISRHDARLSAEVEGRLVAVAEVGEHVAAGGVLARIDHVLLRLQHEESTAEIAQVEARKTFLKREVKRLQRLVKSNNTAQTLLDQTVSDLGVEEAKQASARARLKQIEDRIQRSTIRAPFAGVVMERLHQPGEWVDSGDEVVHLLDPSDLEVRAMAPLSTRAYLKPGMALRLGVDNASVQGEIRTLAPHGNVRSHLMDVRIVFQHPQWTVGQVLEVSVPTSMPRRVVVVPRDALVMRRSGIVVYRLTVENSAERVVVRTGIAQGDFIEVLGDLRPGDRVITRGGERLRPGQKVRVLNEAEG